MEAPSDVAGISDQAAILHAAILDNSGHAIIATDTDGIISVFNRAAERMLGYSASEVIGKLTPALFHKPEEVVERARLFSEETGVPIEPGFEVFVAKARLNLPNNHEWTYIRKDGSILRVLLSITALRNEFGALFGFLGMVVDVSEITVYRSTLEEREAQYRQLFQENPNAMLVYDLDSTRILAANEALLEMYGYQAGALTGLPLGDLLVSEDRARLSEMVVAQADDSNPGTLNKRWRTRHRDGHEIIVETTSRAQTLGEYRARLVLVQEVTDKVLTEKKVADQGRFLSSLLDALPVPVFYKDRAGHYLGGNPAYFSLIGVAPEAYIGKTVDDISPPELAKTYRAADEDVFAEPDVVQIYESRVRSANGDLRDVVFHKAAFRDHQGAVAGLIGILHDITQQRRVDKALRESEARLLQVLHNSPLPIFVVDQNQRVVLWNGACERVIGIPAGDILGTTDAWRAFYPERRPVLANLIVEGGDEGVVRGYYGSSCRRSPLNPDAFESEGFFPRIGDGSGRWLYFSASPLRNAEGEVIGAIETLVDITERKRAEAEARQLTEELELRVEQRTQELARANE
ncbi:PAS domain S-box protein [Dechloromonas sp. ARDL1]|uniref:PAS domain S-box protein n=1 Tax=Dechloromonas sp. ARDL1 TaxID=3322121 RepID=UPI003DA750C2